MTISKVQFDRNGFTIWTEGCDDFYICSGEFIKLQRAIKEWKIKYKKAKESKS
jgi:hypothetical protein